MFKQLLKNRNFFFSFISFYDMLDCMISPDIKHPDCLYVFDFDDTIASTNSFIYIFENINGEERLIQSLKPHEYYEYQVQPNQRIDYSEFDNDHIPESRNVTINKKISKILFDAREAFGDDSVYICSARINPKPIQNIIETHLGLSNIQIDAIGYQGTGINSTPINAQRKKQYIEELVLRRKPKTLYFYDDNTYNIESVNSLNESSFIAELPTKIKCVHVTNNVLTLI